MLALVATLVLGVAAHLSTKEDPLVQSPLLTATVPLLEPVYQHQAFFGFELWGGGFGANYDELLPADYNNDGLTDVLVFVKSGGGWYVYLSNGSAFVPAGIWRVGFGASSDRQFAGDFNGDGYADICTYSSGVWEVCTSSGSSFTQPTTWIQNFGINAGNIAVGDFDGDGSDDILDFYDYGLWEVALSDNVSFSAQSTWVTGFGVNSADQLVANVDGDQFADIIAYYPNGDWYVALSVGSGFQSAGLWRTGFGVGVQSRFAADFDGDGLADIANYYGVFEVCRSDGSRFEWLGTWHPAVEQAFADLSTNSTGPPNVPPSWTSIDVFPGDYDGDGLWDIAALEVSDAEWRVGLALPSAVQTLSIAKNESESFFLLIYAERGDAGPVFLSSEGFPSEIAIAFYHVGYLVEDRTTTTVAGRSQADPLLPSAKKDLVLNRHDMEMTVVSVSTSQDCPAGLYSGFVHIDYLGGTESVPLSVNVWDFALPAQPTLGTHFGLWRSDFSSFLAGHPSKGAVTREALRDWSEELLNHKLSPKFETGDPYVSQAVPLSIASLSSDLIDDVVNLQTAGRRFSNIDMGFPGSHGCGGRGVANLLQGRLFSGSRVQRHVGQDARLPSIIDAVGDCAPGQS